MRLPKLVLVLAGGLLAACGGEGTSTTTAVKPVAKVTITGTASSIQPGQTAQLLAAATDASGAPVSSPGTFTWSSGATSVATVDQSGKVTAVANGQTQISASVAGISGSYAITVTTPTPASKDTIFTVGINFSPSVKAVAPGAAVVFYLGFDGIGHDVRFAVKNGSPQDIPVTVRGAVARTFSVAGEFSYFCPTHPEMTGSIIVQ